MPSIEEIDRKVLAHSTHQKSVYYSGPTTYRGQTINMRHSIRRVSKTLLKLLIKTQFASLNIVGIPGSGKTTCAVNIVTDLVEMAEKQYNTHFTVGWAGPEELRNLGEYLNDLPKGMNHIRIFDDVSKALDQLSGSEQSEVFEKLTTTRHTTGGKLLFINLYHYTYANLKSVKSQAVVNLYTSCSLIEKGNIMAMLGNSNKMAAARLRKFMTVYNDSVIYDKFELNTGANSIQEYTEGKPFRPCFVINLTQAHLGLFMKLDESPFWPPDKIMKTIPAKEVVRIIHSAYGEHGDSALKVHAVLSGYCNDSNIGFAKAHKFIQKQKLLYKFNWPEILAEWGAKPKRIQVNSKKNKELAVALKQTAILSNIEPEEPTEEESSFITKEDSEHG